MIEGWHDEDYLNLFDEAESGRMGRLYALGDSFADYQIPGLIGWDEFILCDSRGELFRVSTVLAVVGDMKPLTIEIDPLRVVPDARFTDRVKWYVRPIVFGGNPERGDNIAWITLDQHVELVRWWNSKYAEMKCGAAGVKTKDLL